MSDSSLLAVGGAAPSTGPPEPARAPRSAAAPTGTGEPAAPSATDTPAAERAPEGAARPAPPTTDLKTLADAANEAAKREATQWFFFVTLMVYLAVAVGGTTHLVLFLEQPVQLPIFNVQVPLVGFYWLAPALLLATHFYLLAQLQVMAGKVRAVLDAAEAEADGDRAAFRRALHRVDEFPVAQLMAAARLGERAWALGGMAWTTLAVAPVGLLLFAQLRFLPYHDEATTWWHRALVLADLALLWWLWPIPATGPGRRGGPWRAAAGTATASVIAFSFVLASIPGEAVGKGGKPADWAVRRWLFDGGLDARQRPTSPFSRSLVLPDEDFVPEDDKAREGVLRTRVLRDRDLRFAVLDRADLRKADLMGARLQGASLNKAQMQGASLDGAKMQGASLNRARMQGASLDGAKMQSAWLAGAEMQGASFVEAEMQGASLPYAKMQGASLAHAKMQGAWLDGAEMQGASLDGAQMQGAWLAGAQVQGASLGWAQMRGAWLANIAAWRADLGDEQNGAALEDADQRDSGFAPAPPTDPDHPGRLRWQDWVDAWLSGVPQGPLRDDAARRLSALTAETSPARDEELRQRWPSTRRPDAGRVADLLSSLACAAEGAPHVARGVIRQLPGSVEVGGRDLGPAARGIAERLSNAERCTGARGFGEADRARLAEISAH